MARRKIIFVIVEGPSDETALGVVLSKLFDSNKVHIQIMHGDITTDKSITATNILAKIGNIIKQYASSNHFSKSDFKEIIHLIDTDGAYISTDCIVKDNCEKPFYDLNTIHAANPENIVQRNLKKKLLLNKLHTTSSICKIPYHAFYMSCNLDHVLYNKLNSSDEEKETDSYHFAQKYRSDIPSFMTYICTSDFSVLSDYQESWEFIKKEKNSLHRHTNLGLGLPYFSACNTLQ